MRTATGDTSPVRSHPTESALREPRVQRRRGVRWFLALAFLGAWLPWSVVHLAGGSMADPIVQLATAGFVPALAACAVRKWVTRQGFARSGLRLDLRSNWRYCLAAVTIPWGILVVAVGVALAAGWWSMANLDMSARSWLYLVAGPLICVVTAPFFWGEEYGWTAYLRDRLVPGRPVVTTFLTGLIWGVWHWPLPWLGYFGNETAAGEALWSMLWWVPLCILLEFVIGWLWSATGSVWPGAMLHAAINLVASQGMVSVFGDTMGITSATMLLCTGLLPFVAVIVLSGHTGGSRAPSSIHGSRVR